MQTQEESDFARTGRRVIDKLLEECNETVERHRRALPEEYNVDEHTNQLALKEVSDIACVVAKRCVMYCTEILSVS
jgi:hypothetical protein